MSKVIAITGNIACGKTTVSGYLKEMGYIVIDMDKIGHLVRDHPTVHAAFQTEDVFDQQTGKIDRKKMGKLVFSDPAQRQKLDQLMKPLMFAKLDETLKKYADKRLVFVEFALLFESGEQDRFDATIVVYLDEQTQLERLMSRNGLTEEEAQKRINAQMPQFEKVKRATYIIYNDGPPEALFGKIAAILPNFRD